MHLLQYCPSDNVRLTYLLGACRFAVILALRVNAKNPVTVLVWYAPSRGFPATERMERELMMEAVDVPVLLPPVPVAAVASGLGAGAGNHAAGTSDTHAAHELILGCLPLVDSIARRMYGALPAGACVELHDLAQSGLLGLVSAGRNYDPAAAVPFSIYARYRIEGEMLDSLRRQDLAPRKLRRWQKQVSAARQELMASLQRPPTEEELCDRLMVSLVEMRNRSLELSRMNAPLSTKRDGGETADPASGPETDPDHICSQRQLREVLDRLIDDLPERHQQVIRWHYCQHMTMKEIGSVMGVNESRVSQMHRSALQAMGRALKDSGICSPADV
jgi:RNA polymerase sigma factor for flagellar operon FliA